MKINAKIDGDVIISVYHARQTNMIFTNKFDKILICRVYFHTGFLGGNTSNMRFKLKDLDLGSTEASTTSASASEAVVADRFSQDFKLVVNFRPEKEVKPMPLKCKNADLNLLFGTKDEMVNNKEMMGAEQPPTASLETTSISRQPQNVTASNSKAASPLFDTATSQQHPKPPPR